MAICWQTVFMPRLCSNFPDCFYIGFPVKRYMSLYGCLFLCSAFNTLQMQCTVLLQDDGETKETHEEYRSE